LSQTGFTPLDSGGCKPVNVSHHRNCPPVSLKHERDTLHQRAKTGQIIDTSNSASAGKRRAEHYCLRPLFFAVIRKELKVSANRPARVLVGIESIVKLFVVQDTSVG
ncbi:hypothetical protein, partial [Rhodopirellula baltica]|uniref:hypothetical protein n=1 Tax=Rhodopirellula baltica TaxID=265606 RepID=UPI001F3B71D3